MDFRSPHIPVLYNEINDLKIKYDGIYLDCTLGFGGHSLGLLKKLKENGKLIGLDTDPYALKYSSERLSCFGELFVPIHSNFKSFAKVLDDLQISKVDGIIFDLGISSYQIDSEHRGFSYRYNSPLDMRMNYHAGDTALKMLRNISNEDLEVILRDYGDIRSYKKIAKSIIEKLILNDLNTTFDLRDAIESVVKAKNTNKILSQVFQAIRIKVNDEIGSLRAALSIAPKYINKSGFIAIITFHSLEDRVVKNFFRKNYRKVSKNKYSPKNTENSFFKFITKKPIVPSKEEIQKNPRSRSAKLRYGIAN